jgi:hypothetical protein
MTATQPATIPHDDVRQLARLVEAIARLRGQVAQRIVGQDEVIDGILTIAAAFLGFGGTMYSLIRQLNRQDREGGE